MQLSDTNCKLIQNNEINLIEKNSISETECSESLNKSKIYKVKNSEWYCSSCDIFCNSKSQFEVHLISTKHSICKKKKTLINIFYIFEQAFKFKRQILFYSFFFNILTVSVI